MERARVPAIVVVLLLTSWALPWLVLDTEDPATHHTQRTEVRPLFAWPPIEGTGFVVSVVLVTGIGFFAALAAAIATTVLEYRVSPQERTRDWTRRLTSALVLIGLLIALAVVKVSGATGVCDGRCIQQHTHPGLGILFAIAAWIVGAFDLLRTLLTRPPQATAL